MRKLFLIIIFFFVLACHKKAASIENTNIKKSIDCVADFEAFFKEFAKDSIFQKDHIKFPLTCSYYEDISSNQLVLKTIKTKSGFKYIDFTQDATAMQNETGKYTNEKIKSKKEAIYKLIGYDNGIMVSYKFEIINGCWTMVEILDEST